MKRSNSDDFNSYGDFDEHNSSTMGTKRVHLNSEEQMLETISNLDRKMDQILMVVASLTEEVMQTRRDVRLLANNAEVEGVNIIPELPFEDVTSFLQFNEAIKDHSTFATLSLNLRSIAAASPREFVFKCWRALIQDSAAKFLCWTGTRQKHSVEKLAVTRAIQDAFTKKYSTTSIDIFTEKTKKFFIYANDRICKSQKYRAK